MPPNLNAYPQILHRYALAETFSSGLALDDDLLDLAHGLRSRGVVESLLCERHGFAAASAKSAAGDINTYVTQGLAFWEQAKSGPSGVSFLPFYYAFLQFAKAVILARGGPTSMKAMIRHGLSYPVALNRTGLSEVVYAYPSGVFAEYYRVLTGSALPDLRLKKNRRPAGPVMTIPTRTVYPYLLDASYLLVVTGVPYEFESVLISQVAESDGVQHYELDTKAEHVPRTLSPLFRITPPGSNRFTCESGVRPSHLVPTYLLWLPLSFEPDPPADPPFWYRTPRWNGRLRYPEEIPLFLAFFHLSSVVRYRPHRLERIMDSEYLPFMRAMERHAATKVMLLFIDAMYDRTHMPIHNIGG